MAQRQRAKRKQKSPRNTDQKQPERFVEAARNLGAEDTERFERAFKKIVPEKKR